VTGFALVDKDEMTEILCGQATALSESMLGSNKAKSAIETLERDDQPYDTSDKAISAVEQPKFRGRHCAVFPARELGAMRRLQCRWCLFVGLTSKVDRTQVCMMTLVAPPYSSYCMFRQ